MIAGAKSEGIMQKMEAQIVNIVLLLQGLTWVLPERFASSELAVEGGDRSHDGTSLR